MPWKATSEIGERTRFVLSALKTTTSFAQLCRTFGISRRVGYKWLLRFKQGGRSALSDRSRRPRRWPRRTKDFWLQGIKRVRQKHPRWGAKKIRAGLQRRHWQATVPSVRTIGRCLKRYQLIPRRPQRTRRGPVLLCPPLTGADAPNTVWTVDFKGWFHTQDGGRAQPLTIRDLFSRYILAINLLPDQRESTVRQAMQPCFRRYGLPRVIRVDNGPPFGGNGALGLSQLSVWWLRLNIQVEFGRRAHPQDNAAHEQMHRVLKAETACPPARTIPEQQQRSDRWRQHYNRQRPHEALNQQIPAQLYHPSSRRFPDKLPTWHYPTQNWEVRCVHTKGQIKWQGRLRFIGRAFIGQWIGLKPAGLGEWEVYLGRQLLGILHQRDPGGMRPTCIHRHAIVQKVLPLSWH